MWLDINTHMNSLALWVFKTLLATIIVAVGLVVLLVEYCINQFAHVGNPLGDKFIKWRMRLNEYKDSK